MSEALTLLEQALHAVEGVISSVPEALNLWNEVAPLFAVHAGVTQTQLDAVNALVPVAHAAVDMAHQGVVALVSAHASGVNIGGTTVQPSPPPAPSA